MEPTISQNDTSPKAVRRERGKKTTERPAYRFSRRRRESVFNWMHSPFWAWRMSR